MATWESRWLNEFGCFRERNTRDEEVKHGISTHFHKVGSDERVSLETLSNLCTLTFKEFQSIIQLFLIIFVFMG